MPDDWSLWMVIGICVAAGYGVTSRLIDAYRTRHAQTGMQSAASATESRPRLAADAPEPRDDEDCFAVLGVPADADEDAVRDAYRHLVSQYHPDKVSALGPELVAVAERQTRRINAAYAEALRRVAGNGER